ncbi:MAG: hypothetical protein GXO03_03510 [Aquificae bacterium]|nr:hypothetical protein [Aquificota bacterium]
MRWSVLLLPSLVLAGEAGHGHSPWELLWKGLNILAFLGIVYYFGRKPIAEAFNKFYASLVESLTRSEQELIKAREELIKAKEELEKAKVKAQEAIALAQETAKTERENILKHAQEVSERIKEKAKESIQIELNRAKKELALYGIQKAEEIAREMLEKEFKKPEVQKRYIEAQLKRLEEKHAKA